MTDSRAYEFETFKTPYGEVPIPKTETSIKTFKALSNAVDEFHKIQKLLKKNKINEAYALLKNLVIAVNNALTLYASIQAAPAYLYTSKIMRFFTSAFTLYLADTFLEKSNSDLERKASALAATDSISILLKKLDLERIRELSCIFIESSDLSKSPESIMRNLTTIRKNVTFEITLHARAWIFEAREKTADIDETNIKKQSRKKLKKDEKGTKVPLGLFDRKGYKDPIMTRVNPLLQQATTKELLELSMNEFKSDLEFLGKDIIPVYTNFFAIRAYEIAQTTKDTDLKIMFYLAAKEAAEIGMQHFAEMEKMYRHFPKAMNQIQKTLEEIITNVSNRYDPAPGDAKSSVSAATSRDAMFATGHAQSNARKKYDEGCDEYKKKHYPRAIELLEESVREFKETIKPRVKALSALALAHTSNGTPDKAKPYLDEALAICDANPGKFTADFVENIRNKLAEFKPAAQAAP